MNRKDLYFLGLLALAYLYVDTTYASDAMPEEETTASEPASLGGQATGTALVRLALRSVPACPRDPGHLVSHRADGAMWCRGCDEGFFPVVAEWERIMSGASV